MLGMEEDLPLQNNFIISKDLETGIKRYSELIRVKSMHWRLYHRGLTTWIQALLGRKRSQ